MKPSSNLVALAGLIIMILRHYRVEIAENEVVAVLGAFSVLGAVLYDWYNKYRSGTITLGGFVKK